MDRRDIYRIWQWNCRGYRRKRFNLQQHLINKESPDIIMIQETHGIAKLSGYKPFSGAEGETKAITTLVKRNLTVVQHDTEIRDIDNILIEIIPTRKLADSLFILNVYSNPRCKKHKFRTLFRKTLAIAGNRAVVIGGDFNAQHVAWGYKFESPKGRNLWLDAQQEGLTLVTDPSTPTRRGNSVCVDTTPDLTFTKNISDTQWINTQQDLGSDHSIIEITVRAGPRKHKGKKLKIVDWDKFRNIRQNTSGEIKNIADWTEQLTKDVTAATQIVPQEAHLEVIDSRLLHMWEAKEGLQRRWRSQRHNRAIRRRIARLNRDIEQHAQQLCKQQWEETCSNMDNQLGLAKTWNLLRYLLHPEETKAVCKQNINKVIHAYGGTEKDFLQEIKEKYISQARPGIHPDYTGVANNELDREISEAEVRAASQKLNTKSAPGPDGITNKILRNLDDESITKLTEYINECWKTGKIPQQWKTAHVILIPKPGRRLQLENLRPISFTSCVGKLMEHAVLARLTNYLEDRDLFPSTMLGFRRNLSTQDAMLQLKHQIIDNPGRFTRAILGLDLKKAFDSVTHQTILSSLEELGLGRRTYNYVRDFLTGRKAKITVGDLVSEEIEIGSAGTPQGSVISPLLFNLALFGLPAKLEEIEGLNHTIYADDITLWVKEGNDGQIEQTLQSAIETVEQYLEGTGLVCSAEKSELLLYRPTRRGRKPNSYRGADNVETDIELKTADDKPISKVDKIRVLGLLIEAKGNNGETIRKLEGTVSQVMRLIKRIANRHSGMKEGNMIRLVQAFVISRIVYVVPYLRLYAAEKIKLECLIRKIYKQAVGLPISTSTDRLLELGLHNTIDELIEAQRIAQYERLSKTKTGRHILEKLCIGYHTQNGTKVDIPNCVRDTITVPPLPKNMHPVYHKGRRESRAMVIQKKFGNSKDAVFVDAARYKHRRGFTAVVIDHEKKCKTCVTASTVNIETAEEIAIALAISQTEADVIVSDSQAAVRNFANGRISPEALRILMAGTKSQEKDVYLIWTPAHTSTSPGDSNNNKVAHDVARGLTDRVTADNTAGTLASPENEDGEEWEWKDRMTRFNDITQHYKLQRCIFPPPHQKLSKKQSVEWRQLQTRTYPNPAISHLIYPDMCKTDKCKNCGSRANLEHMLWECRGITNNNGDAASRDRLRVRWETVLLSSALDDQLWAVQRAEEAARAQELLAVT